MCALPYNVIVKLTFCPAPCNERRSDRSSWQYASIAILNQLPSDATCSRSSGERPLSADDRRLSPFPDHNHFRAGSSVTKCRHSEIIVYQPLPHPAHGLAQNSMFTYPLRISRFCKELNAGFALLNLKNDSLRKRFDGIKCELACIIALREAKSHPQTTSSESRKSFTTSLCEAWCQPMSSRATSGRGRRMELRRCNNAIRIFGFQVTYSPRSGLPFWLYGTYPSAGVLLQ